MKGVWLWQLKTKKKLYKKG